MKDNRLLIKVLCLLNFSITISFALYLSLDGNDWIAVNQNQTITVKGVVPGSIYSDLSREHILNQDLYYGYNDVNYRWVSYDNWTYQKTFDVSDSLLGKQSVNLVAHGIDTISNVYINDVHISNTDNMFIRYKFDVKNKLKVGQNTIRIEFQSPQTYAKTQSQAFQTSFNYSIPPDCNPPERYGECHFNYIRKMVSSFSWDWGPAFPTQGIWKNIGIEAIDNAIIRDIVVRTENNATSTSTSTPWILFLTIYLETATNREMNATLLIGLDEQILVKNNQNLIAKSNGSIRLEIEVPVTGIQLKSWFPNGVADNTQTLYNLNITLVFENSTEVATKQIKIGFRKIELIQDPVTPEGLTFYFKVNGKKIFAKGSNWIPAHVLSEQISKDYLTHLLVSAKEANMNMLRVWGGGIYESDYLYELADQLGIMIWQDFMFACALYPTETNFIKSVDIEIRQQMRRLQHHPSIAIWAGNNENEAALVDHWWPVIRSHEDKYKQDYIELYVNHIQKIVMEEDITRPYVTSSPSNGLETIKEGGVSKNPSDVRYGDVHYYNYLNPLWNWTTYPSAKFASEYGFQSYPSLETLSQVINEANLTFPISKAIEHHQHQGVGTNVIETQIGHYFKLPSHGGIDRLNDLIYLSQIMQAMAMKTETEFYRRNRELDGSGKGYTMGALYWQLNDIWQAPTWASIEFGGKWKLLHSFARNFFNNQLASAYEDNNGNFKVAFVRDDYLGSLNFNCSVQVFKWSSLSAVYVNHSIITTDSFSSNIVFTQTVTDLLKHSNCADRAECLVLIEIENSNYKLAAHNFFLLSAPKDAKIVKTTPKVIAVKYLSQEHNKFLYDIDLTSEAVTPFVNLDFKLKSNISGIFPHNGFFMFVSPKSIRFESYNNYTTQQIIENITVKTVTDVITG